MHRNLTFPFNFYLHRSRLEKYLQDYAHLGLFTPFLPGVATALKNVNRLIFAAILIEDLDNGFLSLIRKKFIK